MNRTKSLIIIFSSIGAVLAATVLTFVILFCTAWKVNVELNAKQVNDEQKVEVVWDVSKSVREVEITVSHKGRKISTTTLSNQKDVLKGSYVVDAFYGNIDISINVKKGIRNNIKTTKVKVFADEYNIAPITATMPVTLFSLNLKEITNNGEIPTFVWFKRSDVWNYTKLPENVYTMPIATSAEIRSNSNQKLIYQKTSAWVKELYELNPSSHFNFYYNDYYAYGWMQATIANGIPATNYDVTLLTDGVASLTYFNSLFTANDTEYTAKYNEMLEDYNTLKDQISDKKYYKENDENFVIEAGKLREYAYVMAKEEDNVTWWLTATRNAIYDINNVDEGTTLKKTDVKALENEGKIVCKALNTSFNAMTPEEKESLKELYSFDSDLFAEAKEQNKKAMVLLGTWEVHETNFKEYVAATIAYYGTEDYVYYYKGHPRNPTPTVDGKMERINNLGLIDVDSTIAAELLFFYFPDVLVCTGYDSSTYLSLTSEQSGSIWNFSGGETGFDAADKTYESKIDSVFTIADSTDSKYGSFVNSENVTVLIEELSSTDIYLYDTIDKAMKHLVYVEGTGYQLA